MCDGPPAVVDQFGLNQKMIVPCWGKSLPDVGIARKPPGLISRPWPHLPGTSETPCAGMAEDSAAASAFGNDSNRSRNSVPSMGSGSRPTPRPARSPQAPQG